MALTRTPARGWGRAADVLWRRSIGVTFVDRAGEVVALGGPAAVLWDLLERPAELDDILRTLADVHGRAAVEVEAEVIELLAGLERRGLVRSDAAASTTGISVVHRHEAPAAPAAEPAAAIAGWDLPGCPLALPDPAVTGWPALLESIRRERLSGLAVAAHLAGDLAVGERDLTLLCEAHADAMITCLRLERLLLDTIDTLEGEHLDPLVIKGPSVARLRYGDPSMRPFGDIDLLVPAAQLDAAFAVLESAGHRRRYPQPRPGFDRQFGKGAAFVTEDGLEIDVHRTFATGAFGVTVDADEAHRDPRTFELGGRTVRTLGDAPTLVSLAMHAVLGTRLPRLLNLRDVAQVASQVDTDAAIALANRWRVDAAVALAVRHTAERFELDSGAPLISWARRHEPAAAQRRALRAYTSADRSYARQALAALPALRGTRARAAYLRAMLLPDRGYVADRDGSQRQRWLRMARVLARGTSRR